MDEMDPARIHQENERAWDLVARSKYAHDVESDAALLASGGTSLMSHELRLLGELGSWCARAIHLQCSHGLDALSLWKLGAREIVGVDISASMLALAQQKAQLLGAPAKWIHSNVLDSPSDLNGTADLVYTGKGALPWVTDLRRWAAVIERLLKPGGLAFIFEGHPLNCMGAGRKRVPAAERRGRLLRCRAACQSRLPGLRFATGSGLE